jgi:NitT/TauT family transport system substrate-binding protein
LVLAVLASACSSSSSTPSGSSSTPASTAGSSGGTLEKTTLNVGALPVADDAALYLAIKNGNFKQVGLTVNAVPVAQSTQAIPDMLHGTVDIIAGANYVSYFLAQSKGALSFKVLVEATACKTNTFGVYTLPSSKITTPAQLAGKSIAVNINPNVQTLTIGAILKADSLSPTSVHYVVIPFPEMVAALKAHRVDAISTIEPFITAAKQSLGAVSALSPASRCPATSHSRRGRRSTRTRRMPSRRPWRRRRRWRTAIRRRSGRSCRRTPRSSRRWRTR